MANQLGGLEGVIAGESAIATVGKEGKGLTYRGYSIEDLAEYGSFEEVAYLLIYDNLPTKKTLAEYKNKLINLRAIPEEIKDLLQHIPKQAHPMDMLRTTCSMLGTIEPENNFSAQYDIANRLLAMLPGALCYWYAYHYLNKQIDERTDEDNIAGHFLTLLHGKKPDIEMRHALDVSLILYAEHEFNASTFAARVTAATCSDIYSAMTTAIGTLRGPLHGGANEAAMELIERFQTPDEAEAGLLDLLAKKAKIMGFGHRVYKKSDPRSAVIKAWANKLARTQDNIRLYKISERIEAVMWREKQLFPNLDFYSASAYHFCDIPTILFTPIFVLSRITGWAAHIFEQRANNRLIRPNAHYIGPDNRSYVQLQQRG